MYFTKILGGSRNFERIFVLISFVGFTKQMLSDQSAYLKILRLSFRASKLRKSDRDERNDNNAISTALQLSPRSLYVRSTLDSINSLAE
jgi:hypothetical protein